MQQHIVQAYDQEIKALYILAMRMSELLQESLLIAKQAMLDNQTNYLLEAEKLDNQINELDIELEQKTITLLALRQPLGVDLRIVISMLRVAVIMERMGDLLKNIVEKAYTQEYKLPKPVQAIVQEMFTVLQAMFTQAFEHFLRNDASEVEEICWQDTRINLLDQQAVDFLKNELQQQIEPGYSAYLTNILFVTTHLERIGDYLKKIACTTLYIAEGTLAQVSKRGIMQKIRKKKQK